MGELRKLHGSVECLGTQRVMASLFEHQIQFQFLPLQPHQTHTPHFLSLSPFGKTPVLQDGHLTLFESRAAMRYISHEYATQAIQQVYMTPLIQGVVANWIDVENHQFQDPAVSLIQELHWSEEAEGRLERVLDVYERRLAASEFLGGDKFTAADLTHMPYLHALTQTARGRRILLEDEKRPHVATWCAALLARPSWASVLQLVSTYSHDVV